MPNAAPRILIVDDHSDLADSVCELLALAGHSAAAVYSTEAAVGHCSRCRPEVAILDYRIGAGMNGVELLCALRQTMPDLIGILMTSDQDYDTAISSLRAGVLDYVRKPAEPEDILAAVEKALARADDLSRKGEELRKLGEEAEAAALSRSFLLSLGAEIREPLSLIMGNAELLAASVKSGSGAAPDFSAIATDIRSGATALLDRVSLANDLCRSGSFDDGESERVAVLPLLRDLARKLAPKALAAGLRIDLADPEVAIYTWTSKLHLRRMVHLFADSLLSIAGPGSVLRIAVETEGCRSSLRLSLPGSAESSQTELASSFGVALALAHRLAIATSLRLDHAMGHELRLFLPAAEPS
ncbi:MAG: response regulator [Rhizobiales bacterium]|nr:response regulator [Hyphomicrobiales bacterium]